MALTPWPENSECSMRLRCGNGYLKTVCDYVQLIPARADLLTAEQPLKAYFRSSYPLHLKEPSNRPIWLRVDWLLGDWRIPQVSSAGRSHLACLLYRHKENGLNNESSENTWF